MEDKPTAIVLDGNGGTPVRLLTPDAFFFIEKATGHIDIVPKDRVSNLFRRDGDNLKYFSHGSDAPPADPAQYVTIEELEDLAEGVSDQARQSAKDALEEPRPPEPPVTEQYNELLPAPETAGEETH